MQFEFLSNILCFEICTKSVSCIILIFLRDVSAAKLAFAVAHPSPYVLASV